MPLPAEKVSPPSSGGVTTEVSTKLSSLPLLRTSSVLGQSETSLWLSNLGLELAAVDCSQNTEALERALFVPKGEWVS